jgi:hypothetical protein
MNHKIKILSLFILLFSSVGCFKDLNTIPNDPDLLTATNFYEDPKSYKQVLAKLYAGFSVTGQSGPAGDADISGIDEGFGQYLRMFWYHQELSTDEALCGWNDQTIKDFHAQTWTSADGFVYAFYSRVFYQIALANEFIRETSDAKLAERGVDAATQADVKKYRAEARFLRALSYWHALDVFRSVPFATEADVVGTFVPKQTSAEDLFKYIESELLAIEGELAAPRANEYARADKAAAWMVLAKLYLNSEVYIGQKNYDKCLEYCEKVMGAGYEMEEKYQNVFLADNHRSKEIIFPITFDGLKTRTYGGMTFIIRAGIGGSMPGSASGMAGGWGGTRTTRQLIEKFPADLTGIKVDFAKDTIRPVIYVPNTGQNFSVTDSLVPSLATTNLSTKIYEGYAYFKANTELQIAQYPSNTGPKFGDNGANGSLETGGEKIKLPSGEGFYFIKVNLANKTYILEKQEFSIYGTATGNVDIPLIYDADTRYLQSPQISLTAGSFKFRANGADLVNMGDNGANGFLEANGEAIQISETGNYRIALNLDKPDYTYQVKSTDFDRRGLFYTDGQTLDIDDVTPFTQGYAVNKFKNVTSEGVRGSDSDFPDTDFPMFRLADAYLMASEAILRGAGGGDKTKATEYVNVVRKRAYTGTSGNFSAADLTLEMLLDERAREFYWECHRRTDLVRFGQFTDGSYKWAWKGGVKEGASVPAFRNIFPIPAADIGANPGLRQNPGY